ncbi:unnamed protein product [Arabis nemorensis]|uniref:Uncharacterized protein n=1 Tax=Arabis nemorensis TaxID=586526 RepID=A0A565CAD9_9BRAS|nr:unnamed protein product [Arabis nemorensis]
MVKAVIKTKKHVESPEERLKAKHDTVYIWFINMIKPNVAKLRYKNDANETIVDLMPKEEAYDTNHEKRPKTNECQQGGIQESVNEHNELEEVGTRRCSSRTCKPIQWYLG